MNLDPEQQAFSPTFKPQPNPQSPRKLDATFDDTKQAVLFPFLSDLIQLHPLSTRPHWQSALTASINLKNESMVVPQKGASLPQDMQLYAKQTDEVRREFEFENIPAPEPYCSGASELIKRIYGRNGDENVEKKYTVAKKRQSHRQTLEPKDAKASKNSIIINPKDTYFSLEKFSKSQRIYKKAYQQSLEETCAELGNNKPYESKYCVDNYLHSQVCPSGLATHKFISVRAKKRLSLMNTVTVSSKTYPFSPRTSSQLASIHKKVNSPRERIAKIKSRKDPHYDEYFQVLVKDTADRDFLKHVQLFKDKKTKSYGSRREELEDVIQYMRNERVGVEMAHDIVMEVIGHRKEEMKKRQQVK